MGLTTVLSLVALAGLLVVLGMLGRTFWAARGSPSAAEEQHAVVLVRAPLLLRVVAFVAAFGLPLMVTGVAGFNPPRDTSELCALVGFDAVLAALSAPLLWAVLRFALVVTPEGLDCRSPWRGRRFVPWEQVATVSYRSIGPWFLIEARDGYRFRVPLLPSPLVDLVDSCEVIHPGPLDRLLDCCEEHLAPEQFAPAKAAYQRAAAPFARR